MFVRALAILTALAVPAAAFAHTPASGMAGGFAQGIGHALGGADHLLAAVALGLWGLWLGGRINGARVFALGATALLAAFALVHGVGGAEPLFVLGLTAAAAGLAGLAVAAAKAAEKIRQPRTQALARTGAVVLAAGGILLLVA